MAAGDGVLPPSGVQTGQGFLDTLNNAFAFTLTKAVDAEFNKSQTINSDPTNWPAYNGQGQAFNRGAPSGIGAGVGGMSAGMLVLIAGGALLVVVLLVRR